MYGAPRAPIAIFVILLAALVAACGDDDGNDGGTGPGAFPDMRGTYSAAYEYRVDRDGAPFLEGTCSGGISIARQDAESFSGSYSRADDCALDPYSSTVSGTVDEAGNLTVPFLFGEFFNVESLDDVCSRISGSLSLRGAVTNGAFLVETTVSYTCAGDSPGEYDFHLSVTGSGA